MSLRSGSEAWFPEREALRCDLKEVIAVSESFRVPPTGHAGIDAPQRRLTALCLPTGESLSRSRGSSGVYGSLHAGPLAPPAWYGRCVHRVPASPGAHATKERYIREGRRPRASPPAARHGFARILELIASVSFRLDRNDGVPVSGLQDLLADAATI